MANMHIDTTLVAYAVSFVSLLALLYWKMRRQFLALLDAKQKGIQDAMQTADYIKNFSVTVLYEETKKQNNIQDEVDQIKAEGQKQIDTLLKAHKDFQVGIQKQFEAELDEHIKQINSKFIQDIKEEMSQIIMDRLRQRLQVQTPYQSPAQQFATRMRSVN